MVTGGMAAIVYGEPRLTQDLDIVVAIDPNRANALAAQFPEGPFYCPPVDVIIAEAGRAAHGHFNLLHLESGVRADVYVAGRDRLMRRGLDGRRIVSLADRDVPLAPPEYVILQKLRYRQQGATERHLRDVRAMLRVLGDTVDTARLKADATSMGLGAQWSEMEKLAE